MIKALSKELFTVLFSARDIFRASPGHGAPPLFCIHADKKPVVAMNEEDQSVVCRLCGEKGWSMNDVSNGDEAGPVHDGLPPILSAACATLAQAVAVLSRVVVRQQESVAVVAQLNTEMDRAPLCVARTEAAIDQLIVEQLMQGHAPRTRTAVFDGGRPTAAVDSSMN
jgi:hypothetical protein